MKILLLGEYSGFHINLAEGLRELGQDVTLRANGDGWKNIYGADKPLYKKENKNLIKKAYLEIVEPVLQVKQFSGYDIVNFVGNTLFYPQINSHMFREIKKYNKKIFISATGDSYSLYQAWKSGKLGGYIYDNNWEKCKRYEAQNIKCKMLKKSEQLVEKLADGIIPTMYEYAVGIRNKPNCRATIQIPFNSTNIVYRENRVKNKIVFFHGIIREECKGTKYIREAFEIIEKRYPNDVECRIKGRLPLKEYLNVLSQVNVLVDQCKGYSWGYNACYAMAMGKVVMCDASFDSLQEFGLLDVPIIDIIPNTKQIVQQMENIIENREQIIGRGGYQSRKFVETFHNHVTVAQKYLDEWKK